MSEVLKALSGKAKIGLALSTLWLAFWGTIFVASATWYPSDSYGFRQFLYLIVGLLFFLVTSAYISYPLLARLSSIIYIASLVFLLVSVIWGHRRWIHIGFLDVQPYEFSKIGIVIWLASLLANPRKSNSFWKTVALPLLTLLPAFVILICQPHFGACVLLGITALVMLYLAGVPIHQILLVTLAITILLVFLLPLESYRIQRITALLKEDPLGKDFQKNQALIAIGSGGPFGKGFGRSAMKFGFLPEAHTDFLFAIASEEMGFFWTCIVILIPFIIFLLFGCSISFSAPSPFAALLAGGLTSLFAIQAIINLSMVSIKWVPVTGLPLPFFTYGGSSLISSCIAAGILHSIAQSQEGRQKSRTTPSGARWKR